MKRIKKIRTAKKEVRMDIESVEKIYSKYSGVYDLVHGKTLHSGRRIAIKLMDMKPGDRILEVGIGTGLSLPFYRDDCEIVGIDLSTKMLEEAKKKVKKLGLSNVILARMDASSMDFDDDTFDMVFAGYVLSTVPDPVKVIKEMHRVCRKGGKIVFLNHFKSNIKLLSKIEKAISPFCTKIGFRTDLDFSTLMEKVPMKVKTIRGVNLFGYWKVVECINNKPLHLR